MNNHWSDNKDVNDIVSLQIMETFNLSMILNDWSITD